MCIDASIQGRRPPAVLHNKGASPRSVESLMNASMHAIFLADEQDNRLLSFARECTGAMIDLSCICFSFIWISGTLGRL